MTRALQFAHLLVLLAVTAFMGVIGWRAWAVADHLDSALSGLVTVESKLDATITNINRPCKGPAGPDACGTLAQINKTSIAIGDIANDSKIQLQHSGDVLIQTQTTLQGIGTDVHAEMLALQDTTKAGSQTLHGASLALSAATDTISAFKPLLVSAKTAVDDTDRFINRPALGATVDNFETISGNMAATSTDFQTKFHAFLYPPKCLTKWCKVKRAWPYIKGATEMAEPAYWGLEVFKGATP